MNSEFIKSRRLRVGISILIAAAALFIITGQVRRIRNSKETVLTLGVFSDSYWGVQSGYANKIIDDAISRFEAEHPDVKVQYESGIMKTDYSEWLSEQMMKGTEPDVFFVPEADFSTFAQINALKNLNELIINKKCFSGTA
ncbi:MAG: extracellular solute-binding protein [Lachnospiraceae bacterium]|nr:extracellular solute-binding protein [Lachnospiraceae bacterium]